MLLVHFFRIFLCNFVYRHQREKDIRHHVTKSQGERWQMAAICILSADLVVDIDKLIM